MGTGIYTPGPLAAHKGNVMEMVLCVLGVGAVIVSFLLGLYFGHQSLLQAIRNEGYYVIVDYDKPSGTGRYKVDKSFLVSNDE